MTTVWKYALSYSLKVVSCAALGLVSAAQVVQMLRGKAKRLNAVFSSAAWVPFARVSYSAYLLQFFFIGPTYAPPFYLSPVFCLILPKERGAYIK